jgi:predicted 2-oxoglutarate/Fe(II)-dependent dioxygenase YbiX
MENILDFIKVYKGAVSNELCDDIVHKYKDSDKFTLAHTESGRDGKVRNCYNLDLTEDKDIDDRVFIEQAGNINRYREDFPHASIKEDTGYALLKYKTGGFYLEHVDHAPELVRTVSCSIILNDDYEGGEFGFFGKEHIIKAGKGDVIMFPSNFVYRHEVLPVTKGTRYAIITWFK